jgi:hypothetical protein
LPPLENLGFVYAAEASEGSFEDFRAKILQANAHLPTFFKHGSAHVFHAPDGTHFRIWFSLKEHKYRARVTDEAGDSPDLDRLPLVSGEFLRSDGHSGRLEIRYPGCDDPLVLDYRDPRGPLRTGTSACPGWYERVWAAYTDQALERLRKGETTIALETTREGLDEFRRARLDVPGLSNAPLYKLTEKLHSMARAAHPNDVPVQLAAAQNSWQVYQFLALEETPDAAQIAILAPGIADLAGYLAFGSPITTDASAAANLARSLYARLRGDHALDIAGVWTNQAQHHHVAAFRAGNPDPTAELSRQRESAAEAFSLLEPVVRSLPSAEVSIAELEHLAALLTQLIGLVTFGSPDSGPSVRVVEVLRLVYAQVPGRDHRLDLANACTILAQRHHLTAFVEGCPDPTAELSRQRESAAEATRLLLDIGDQLLSYSPPDRKRATDLLDTLTGQLVFGAPPPPDPRTEELQKLANSAAILLDALRATL